MAPSVDGCEWGKETMRGQTSTAFRRQRRLTALGAMIGLRASSISGAGRTCLTCFAASLCLWLGLSAANAQTSGAPASSGSPVVSNGRCVTDQKGSLLIYSLVEVKWDAHGELIQDTFVQLLNDFAGDVRVQFYFVNGDEPLDPQFTNTDPPQLIERAHTGWNWVDTQFTLTDDQSVYWSAASGQPQGVPLLSILDPGIPAGRPDNDPDNPGGRVLRAYLMGWAVDNMGHEIRWNHLSGNAVIVNYRLGAAAEYPAWAFQAHSAPHGQQTLSCFAFNLESGQCIDSRLLPGRLDLDGYEYDNIPDKLLIQFNTAGSSYPGQEEGIPDVAVDTQLVVFPVATDLRQDTTGPITTKAKFDIWNENEVRFSGTERCVTCWDGTDLERYITPPGVNHFLMSVIQTTTGKARASGLGSSVCAGPNGASRDAAILGISLKKIRFPSGIDTTAVPLVGQGDMISQIFYDIITPPEESNR